ncbi:hypothetical protein SAY87_002761 [Trapa incisa]|uniref:Uncharacterized protein n=1 Tax=Trapa incisa TaxID=236973 RepID=A0AAN7JWT1_9MYRT|nr:hypothetical protein SAY87_002761 [Trapa incisa]
MPATLAPSSSSVNNGDCCFIGSAPSNHSPSEHYDIEHASGLQEAEDTNSSNENARCCSSGIRRTDPSLDAAEETSMAMAIDDPFSFMDDDHLSSFLINFPSAMPTPVS